MALRRLTVGSSSDVYYLLTRPGDYYDYAIVDPTNNAAYRGRLAAVDSHAASLRVSVDDYIQQSCAILSNDNDEYRFELERADSGGAIVALVWCKALASGGEFEHGRLAFVDESKNGITYLAEVMSEENRRLVEALKVAEVREAEAQRSCEEALRLASDAQHAKQDIELELFTGFTAAINEKKRRIRELEEFIEHRE